MLHFLFLLLTVQESGAAHHPFTPDCEFLTASANHETLPFHFGGIFKDPERADDAISRDYLDFQLSVMRLTNLYKSYSQFQDLQTSNHFTNAFFSILALAHDVAVISSIPSPSLEKGGANVQRIQQQDAQIRSKTKELVIAFLGEYPHNARVHFKDGVSLSPFDLIASTIERDSLTGKSVDPLLDEERLSRAERVVLNGLLGDRLTTEKFAKLLIERIPKIAKTVSNEIVGSDEDFVSLSFFKVEEKLSRRFNFQARRLISSFGRFRAEFDYSPTASFELSTMNLTSLNPGVIKETTQKEVKKGNNPALVPLSTLLFDRNELFSVEPFQITPIGNRDYLLVPIELAVALIRRRVFLLSERMLRDAPKVEQTYALGLWVPELVPPFLRKETFNNSQARSYLEGMDAKFQHLFSEIQETYHASEMLESVQLDAESNSELEVIDLIWDSVNRLTSISGFRKNAVNEIAQSLQKKDHLHPIFEIINSSPEFVDSSFSGIPSHMIAFQMIQAAAADPSYRKKFALSLANRVVRRLPLPEQSPNLRRAVALGRFELNTQQLELWTRIREIENTWKISLSLFIRNNTDPSAPEIIFEFEDRLEKLAGQSDASLDSQTEIPYFGPGSLGSSDHRTTGEIAWLLHRYKKDVFSALSGIEKGRSGLFGKTKD